VLIRRHRAGINVEIRIEFLQRDFEAAIFEQRAERGGRQALPNELTTPPVTNMNFISNYF